MLSVGGKEILIKAVTQAIPTYTMSCFQLPKGLCEDLERMERNFWWGQRDQEAKMAWVSWRKMCKSKSDGGMGFRNLQAFNLAMLAKQAWRIMTNPNSLIARIYKAKYFPFGDILDAKLGSNPSYAWRSIYNSLEVIRKGVRWRVGNGKMIHIWEDKWLPNPTTYKVCSPLQDIGDFPMVSLLIDEETRHWKVGMVKRFFLPFEAETILNIPLNYNLPEDSIIWLGNKRGVFTVRNAYYVALPIVENSEEGECSSGDSRTRLWKKVWQLKLPVKVRIFAWKACMDGLPTKLKLAKRGLNVGVECPLCEKAVESSSHALIYCNKVCEVWWNWQNCPINLLAVNRCFVDLAVEILDAGSPNDLETLFVTAWAIWFNKNQVVHESQIWNLARHTQEDYKNAVLFCRAQQQQAPDVGWAAPPPDVYKINVDGATAGIGCRSSVGVVIRDCRGMAVAAVSKVLNGNYGAAVTEAFAVEEGIRLAREMELQRIIVESDSCVVVDAFNESKIGRAHV